MAGRGPTAKVNLESDGSTKVVADINKIKKAGDGVQRQFGSASRTAANFGASMASAGTLGATSLAGIAQQISEMAFGFGPAGPVIGALATTTIAIGAMVFKAQAEMDKFQRSLRKLLFDSSFDAAQAQFHDLQFDIQEAQNEIAALKTLESVSGPVEAAIAAGKRLLAERELNTLLAKRAALVPVVQKLAAETGARQASALKRQQEAATQAEREAAAKRATTQAVKERADIEAASAALTKASAGITLGGPSVDLGLGSLDNAPTIPVQVAPEFGDTAQAEWLAHLDEMAPMIQMGVQNTFGGAIEDGFTAAFTGKNPLKAFGKSILSGLGRIFIDMGKQLIGFGAIMAKLSAFLTNPLTAGPAAIAAGAALIALGAALSSIAGGGTAGNTGGAFNSGVGVVTAPSQITNITLASGSSTQAASKLSPQQPITFNVIGPNDPAAQRGILELIDNGRRRGL